MENPIPVYNPILNFWEALTSVMDEGKGRRQSWYQSTSDKGIYG